MLKEKNQQELYHLGFDPKKYTADYAIIPGDPDRVDKIVEYLDSGEFVAQKREFRTFIGKLGDKKVFICSTGIGGPSCAIAVEELIKAGVKTFIRVGTCGGINLGVDGSDLVIATSAVRQEGTTLHYAPIEYPATADFYVIEAIKKAAEKTTKKTHIGVVQSKDSFYGQHSPTSSPVAQDLLNKWSAWKDIGVLASEMESSTLFTVAAARGVKAGAVFSVVWNQERHSAGLETKEDQDTSVACKVAVDAIKLL